jgi:A/G-specific adenine glycosylase
MLQQTQVKKVLSYYEAFIGRFPDIQGLAAADLEAVLKVWEKMGYYGRARNLHRAAQIVVQDMGGEIPAEYAVFRKLPGVGEYIAAAVQSIGFNKPYAVTDGNVKRVISRLFLIDSPLDRTASLTLVRERAAGLLDPERPGLFNQAMMELGATVCHPRRPECSACPVSPFCEAFHTGREHEIPVMTRARSVPEHHTAAGVIHKDDLVLITRRKPSGLLGGLWEFPGGRVMPGETPEEACLREIKEEVNLSVDIIEPLTQVRHAYTHLRIVMDVFRCRYRSGQIVLRGPVDCRWITIDEIDAFPFPVANHKFIPLVKEKCSIAGPVPPAWPRRDG